MSLLKLNPMTSIIEAIGNVLSGLDELFTSDEERDKAELDRIRERVKVQLAQIQNQAQQIAINAEQAKHPSVFVAGARPAILWVFAAGLAFTVLVHPIIEWIVRIVYMFNPQAMLELAEALKPGGIEDGSLTPDVIIASMLPKPFEFDELYPLIAGILGMAGWRSFDKKNGVARQNMRPTLSNIVWDEPPGPSGSRAGNP